MMYKVLKAQNQNLYKTQIQTATATKTLTNKTASELTPHFYLPE